MKRFNTKKKEEKYNNLFICLYVMNWRRVQGELPSRPLSASAPQNIVKDKL